MAVMAEEWWPNLGGCADKCPPNRSNTKTLMEADLQRKTSYAPSIVVRGACMLSRDINGIVAPRLEE
jgi:hypothetical protein